MSADPVGARHHDRLDPTGTLTELAAALRGTRHFDQALDGVAVLARRRIPGADAVSITLVDDGPGTVASSCILAADLDERQYRAGAGPCLQAAESGAPAAMNDVAAEQRWPEFVAAARAAGIGSSLSVPLPVQHLAGALNLYAQRPNGFSEVSGEVAVSFAAHAARALAQSFHYVAAVRTTQELQDAMRSRAVIEQAKGILMAAHRCSASQALDTLVRLSETQHRKLREVAAGLVSRVSTHRVEPDDG